MSDVLNFVKEPGFIGAVIGYLFVTIIRFVLRRKFPQMGPWKVAAVSAGIPLALCIAYFAYLYFSTSLSDHRDYPSARVEWRTEIRQADEPETWPFKESRYMLSCLGGHGEYSVYLVKLEDIAFDASRARDFQPQYYGLKGSWNGWEKGETQLLDGQTNKVFQKYVDRSLSLCKEAEARKDGG